MSNDFIQNAVNALYRDNEVAALKGELANLKAERDQLKADLEKSDGVVWTLSVENARLKAEVDRLAMSEGYHYTAVSISTLKEQLHQKHLDYIEARKANEAKVEIIKSLKAEVERLTKAALQVHQELDEFGQVSAKSVHELRDAVKGVQS
jgi:chromosome segregation ATPase